jgi:hypothetical protein
VAGTESLQAIMPADVDFYSNVKEQRAANGWLETSRGRWEPSV